METFTITMKKEDITLLIAEVSSIIAGLTAGIAANTLPPDVIPVAKMWIDFGNKLLEATSDEN
jgi:hypothetical protein